MSAVRAGGADQRTQLVMSVIKIVSKVREGDESFVSDLSDEDWKYLQTAKDDDGRTYLHTVAACGRVGLLQTFLQHGCGVGVNIADEDGWTPLLSAASGGHEGAVQLLLGAGADACAVNSTKRSALHYAASKGHVRVAQILIEAGMPSPRNWERGEQTFRNHRQLIAPDIRLLIISIVEFPDVALSLWLLGGLSGDLSLHNIDSICAGAQVNAADTVGATPLHRACSNSCAPLVEALIQAGASVAAVDKVGNTPLHVAVSVATDRATAEAAFILARHGADLHAVNKDEETPLGLAGANGAALEAAAGEAANAMDAS